MLRTNPMIEWLSQRVGVDAWTDKAEPYNQCMVYSFTMMMQWLRQFLINNGKPSFENYTALTHYIVVGESESKVNQIRFNSVNHATKLNTMLAYKKIPYEFVAGNLALDGVKRIVQDLNSPVLIGSMLTTSGHILVYDGLFQDPYGHAENQIIAGNAIYKNVNGKDSDYSDDFARQMIFREMSNGKTTTAMNVQRPCWYIKEKK